MVPANADPDFAVPGVPRLEPKVAGGEIKFLVIERIVWNVHLAVLAEQLTVRVDDRGVISMAREPDPDSAGSQFFICLGPVHRLDHQYTTFGKLIKGDDVLEKIGETPVTKNSMGEMSKPTKRIVINKIDMVPGGSVK